MIMNFRANNINNFILEGGKLATAFTFGDEREFTPIAYHLDSPVLTASLQEIQAMDWPEHEESEEPVGTLFAYEKTEATVHSLPLHARWHNEDNTVEWHIYVDVPQIEADADTQVISHYQPFSDFEVVLPSKKEIEQLRKVKQYGIIIEHEALDNVIVIPSYWEAGAHYYDFGTVRKAVKDHYYRPECFILYQDVEQTTWGSGYELIGEISHAEYQDDAELPYYKTNGFLYILDGKVMVRHLFDAGGYTEYELSSIVNYVNHPLSDFLKFEGVTLTKQVNPVIERLIAGDSLVNNTEQQTIPVKVHEMEYQVLPRYKELVQTDEKVFVFNNGKVYKVLDFFFLYEDEDMRYLIEEFIDDDGGSLFLLNLATGEVEEFTIWISENEFDDDITDALQVWLPTEFEDETGDDLECFPLKDLDISFASSKVINGDINEFTNTVLTTAAQL